MTSLAFAASLLAQVNASDRASLIAGAVVGLLGLVSMLFQMRTSFTQSSGDGHH